MEFTSIYSALGVFGQEISLQAKILVLVFLCPKVQVCPLKSGENLSTTQTKMPRKVEPTKAL